jgi:Reverse transcriptase (RNA-dependent DNA polymerase)
MDFAHLDPPNADGYKYVVTMMCECTGWLQAVPIKERSSATVWQAFEQNWLRVFGTPQGLRCLVRHDHGTEFKKDFAANCSALGLQQQLTPVNQPQGNSLLERRHWDVAQRLKSIIVERELSNEQFVEVLPLAVSQVNHQPASRPPYESPYTRLTRRELLPPSLEGFLQDKTKAKERITPRNSSVAYQSGDLVFFRHPRVHKYPKLEICWLLYRVVRVVSTHIYQLESLEIIHFNRPFKILAHSSCMFRAPPGSKPRLRVDLSSLNDQGDLLDHQEFDVLSLLDQQEPAGGPFQADDGVKDNGEEQVQVPVAGDDEVTVNYMCLFKHEEKELLFIGKVVQVAKDKVKVQHYGTYGKGGAIDKRVYRPALVDPKDGKAIYSARPIRGTVPDLFDVERTDILIAKFELEGKGTIPLYVINLIEQLNHMEYVLFCGEQYDASALKLGAYVQELDRNADNIILDINTKEGAVLVASGYVDDATATTHQKLKYKQLSAQQKKGVDAARAAECAKIVQYGTYRLEQKYEKPADVIPIETLWVDTLKLVNGKREYKSRLVARGDQDKRAKHDLDCKTAACPPESVRFLLLAALASPNYAKGKSIVSIDIKNAYLQAELKSKSPVYIIPPAGHEDRRAGRYWVLNKAMYGLPDAGKAFERFLIGKLTPFGWTLSPIRGLLWKLREVNGKTVVASLLAQYVDDLIVACLIADTEKDVQEVRSVCDCKYSEALGRFVGTNYHEVPEGVWCEQSEYILSLKPGAGKTPKQPLPRNLLEYEDKSLELNGKQRVKDYQKLLGEISYVAFCSRPDLTYPCSMHARRSNAPTEQAWQNLNATVRYAQATAHLGILLKPPKYHEPLHLTMYVDASLGNWISPRAQSAYVLTVNNRPVSWRSHAQEVVARSTYRSELHALEMGVDKMAAILPFFRQIWPDTRPLVLSDSANVIYGIADDAPTPRETSLLLRIRMLGGRVSVLPNMAVKDAIRLDKITVRHVKSEDNVTDCLTKPMSAEGLTQLMLPPPSMQGKVTPKVNIPHGAMAAAAIRVCTNREDSLWIR